MQEKIEPSRWIDLRPLRELRTCPSCDAGGGRDREVNPAFGIPEEQYVGKAELSISYDLNLFGRLVDSSEAARSALLSNEASRDNVRLAVAASAASGYISLRGFDARSKCSSKRSSRAESLRIAKRRAETGYASQLDLAQTEADYRAAEQQIPAAELAITRQENGLSVLLGDSPHSIERGVELGKLALPAVPVSLPAKLMRCRPDIIAAEEQVATADHSLDAARDTYMPDVRISADGGLVGSTLFPSPIWIFSLGGGILAPIFDAGRLDAQQEAAAARRSQAAFAYRKTALMAFKEVEDAMAALRDLDRQEASLIVQQQSLQRALTLAINHYREGYSPYLDQLDAERGLLASELALVQLRTDRLNAAVSLFQALGGGWDVAK